jgi:hypothetical protein
MYPKRFSNEKARRSGTMPLTLATLDMRGPMPVSVCLSVCPRARLPNMTASNLSSLSARPWPLLKPIGYTWSYF